MSSYSGYGSFLCIVESTVEMKQHSCYLLPCRCEVQTQVQFVLLSCCNFVCHCVQVDDVMQADSLSHCQGLAEMLE